MSSVTPIFEGFSVSHVSILDGATTAEDAALTLGTDVYGVRSAALTPDSATFDNEGDDAILSTWYWFNFATLDVVSGYISLPVLAALTGRPISSSGAGANVKYDFDLYHEDMFNVSRRPVLVRIPSKDASGNVRRLDFVVYSMQFGPFTFNGPAYKAGLEVTYTGRALSSIHDETGTPFSDGKKRVGRMISGPQI
jgi:hypothetical protein